MTLAGQGVGRKHKARRAPAGASRVASSVPQAADLLAWYDRHRRRLPWRAGPGEQSDPYRVWLSEIMLQQTTVKAVAPYYARFLERFPTVEHLARAPLDDVLRSWAGLGYYARARNLHACAQAVTEQHGGRFPSTEAGLAELPGIGPYTAAAIAAIAFDARATPVDGNIERVVARLFAVEDELPDAKPEIRRLAATLTPARRAGDFAQAMMDLGATLCTPKKPACALCPWNAACAAQAQGNAALFPRRVAKREGELRRGAAFVVRRADDCVLLRTRPARGLLGGMTEVPTTAWTADFDASKALADAPRFYLSLTSGERQVLWRRLPGVVRHVFTHFPLELTVYRTEVARDALAAAGTRWIAIAQLGDEALPSLMRKVVARGLRA
jgi:A/G-specific adenine glycosylase